MRPYAWSLFIYAGLAAGVVMGAESSEEMFSALSTALSEDDQCAGSGAESPSPHCSLSALQLRGAKLGVDEEDSHPEVARADLGAEPAFVEMEEAVSESKPKATAAPVERRNDLTSSEAAGLLRKATSQEKDIKKEKEQLNNYWASLNETRAKVDQQFPSQLLLQAAAEALRQEEELREELSFELSSQGPRETQVSKKLMNLQHQLNRMWKSITDLDRSNTDLKNQVGSYRKGKLLQQESNQADPEDKTAESSETAEASASEAAAAAEETPTVESTDADTTAAPEELASKRKSTKGNTTHAKVKEQSDDDEETATPKKKLKGAAETTKAPKSAQPRSGQPKEDPAAAPGLSQLKTFSDEISKQIEKFQHELDKAGVALDTVTTQAENWLKKR